MTINELINYLLIIIILGLGSARISALIVLDDIFEGFRDYVFMRFPPFDNDAQGWYYQIYRKATKSEYADQKHFQVRNWKKKWIAGDKVRSPHFIGRLLSCYKCVSVWVAFGNYGLYLIAPAVMIMFNAALAISFIATALISKYYN